MDWKFVAENGPIPSVNPADLRSVEAVQRDVRSRFPGKRVLMDNDAWKRACSHGADLFDFEKVFIQPLIRLRLDIGQGIGDDNHVSRIVSDFNVSAIGPAFGAVPRPEPRSGSRR